MERRRALRDMIRMIVVLTVIATVMGTLLSVMKDLLAAQIEYSTIKFVKGPAVLAVFTGYENDPLRDVTKKVVLEEKDGSKVIKSLFPAKRNGKSFAVAFEVTGKGYGGYIGIMMGVDLKTGHLTGMRVMTHLETPGLGARSAEPEFYKQFFGLELKDVALSAEGGKINAITGATNTSTGVVQAVKEGLELFDRTKEKIISSVGSL
jgi:electron transport complex protein RnfG